MQAYGGGMINVQMFHNGRWHDSVLKNTWYVPDASTHLFSVKAAAQNGYCTTLNEKGVIICSGDGTVAASGKLVNDLYFWRFGCVFHDTLQKSTCQRKWKHCKYGMNVLVIKVSAML